MTATQGRQHFLFLDGLRGVAALAVVLLHWFDGLGYRVFGASILAVDFFFMLSGFVVAYAYKDRLRQGYPVGRFLIARVIRLYPLILAGVVAGIVRLVGAAYAAGAPLFDGQLVKEAILTLLMIPSDLKAGASFFPLNIALWSLHFEFIAYLAFGLLLHRIRDVFLLLPICAAAIGAAAWSVAYFGPGADGTSFLDLENYGYFYGLSRVAFSFMVGVLLFGMKERGIFQLSVPAPVAIIALVGLFAAPVEWLPSWIAMAALGLVFPAIIAGGSRVNLAPKPERLARFFGDLSYPLYALHTPVIWMLNGVAKAKGFRLGGSLMANGLIVIPVTIFLTYAVFRLWDLPVRKLLKQQFLRSPQPKPDFANLASETGAVPAE
ncbi:acyltransferase family protein [Novosphingobium malaysiense]|uniref:Acyltransferase 3 domain-containing protein n=1 Tax=Novosphingobium malaysiense TaxID=1348853 RepID=A0A0B1ZJT7_9SPHN|nr:acyltransferase [Novosphingobium malaysiense]KHK89441.1 hypothetical protein LK12_20165 [Novosphingobium malaysiense]